MKVFVCSLSEAVSPPGNNNRVKVLNSHQQNSVKPLEGEA
jgi:hypothetical protein